MPTYTYTLFVEMLPSSPVAPVAASEPIKPHATHIVHLWSPGAGDAPNNTYRTHLPMLVRERETKRVVVIVAWASCVDGKRPKLHQKGQWGVQIAGGGPYNPSLRNIERGTGHSARRATTRSPGRPVGRTTDRQQTPVTYLNTQTKHHGQS